MAQKQKQFQSMEDIRNTFVLYPVKNKKSVPKWKVDRVVRKTDPTAIIKGGAREFIAKLSKGLMLPITMLPIAGLFLGIGSAIVNNAGGNVALQTFGKVLQLPGQVVFDNLAVLFCIAVAISFTNESGVAGLCSFMRWLVFNAIQYAFIITYSHTDEETKKTIIDGYSFWWYYFKPEEFTRIFGTNIGIPSLNTSVFGGIIIGFLTAYLYNRFKNIQMPPALGFFSGVRFIPIATFIGCFLMAMLFCAVWPGVGLGIYYLGVGLSKAPLGINALFYGYINRALVPTGLHHAFNGPFWFSSAGGQITLENNPVAWNNLLNYLHAKEITVDGYIYPINGWDDLVRAIKDIDYGEEMQTVYSGDINCFAFANSIAGHTIKADGVDTKLTFDMINQSFGLRISQYQKGAYPMMIFGLPAAACAMIICAPKGEGRKLAFSAVIGSAVASAVTGITEPIEFTFLFLAPALYYGFHAVVAGVSYWVMNIVPACVGFTFSAGLIDFVIYGAVPEIIGAGSNCWWIPVIGVPIFFIYFFGFWAIIKRWDIKTPGREGGLNKLMTKKDVLGQNAPKETKNEIIPESNVYDVSMLSNEQLIAWDIILAYGGKDNILNVDACITKLRIQVASPDLVNDKRLVELGALGVTHPSSQSVYAVFGAKADYWKNMIKEVLEKVKPKPQVYTE